MRYSLLILVLLVGNLSAQCKFRIAVRDSVTDEPLAGSNISIKNSSHGSTTNQNGSAIITLNKGKYDLLISYVGYNTKETEITAGQSDSIKNIIVLLSPVKIEVQQVTVSTSRVNSYINNNPQRIEILGTEELQEKTIENPANISEMLSELSAVQVVQTSSFSGTTNFRLLGLSGQYTQILKDGFPLFGGLSQDFGLIQIPPLDLEQIEIIKGASATFYGNGAVAGIINLISKEPEEKPKAEALLNATDYGGIDAGAFYSSKKSKAAFTTLLTADFKPPKDVNGDGFTEISKLKKFDFEPKLFLELTEKSSLKIGASIIYDEHVGGDIAAVNSSPSSLHPFVMKSVSNRYIGTAVYQNNFSTKNSLNIKSGISFFDLSIESPKLFFKGKQISSFSEISFSHNSGSNHFTGGLSLMTDNFKRDINSSVYFKDALQSQFGLFAVDNLQLSDEVNFQLGLRFENSSSFKSYFLPNASLIYKPANNFFVRLGYGTGYRIPTAISFLGDLERNDAGLTVIIPPANAELSNSFSFDFNYELMLAGELFIKLNQTFFRAEVKNPYLETTDENKDQTFLFTQTNALQSYGTETNLRLGIEDASLFVGLTYQKTERKYMNNTPLPLSPDFKVVSIFQIEDEDIGEVDLGNIYNGSQYLSDGEKVKPYTTFEALLKIKTGLFDVVLNCENIFNVMQSKTSPLVIPPYQSPRFSEIWEPIEGRTFNVSIIYSY